LRGSPSIVLERSALPVNPGLTPRTLADQDPAACQLLQSPRFLSTTMDLTAIPRAPPRVTPLRCVDAAASLLSKRRWPSCHRLRGRRTTFRCFSCASRRTKRGSLSPILFDPDTSCHDPVSTPAGRSRAQSDGTKSPRARRRTAQGRPRQGCITQLSAKKVRIRAPEVSSISRQPRRAGS
jgi:hypothetical protein